MRVQVDICFCALQTALAQARGLPKLVKGLKPFVFRSTWTAKVGQFTLQIDMEPKPVDKIVRLEIACFKRARKMSRFYLLLFALNLKANQSRISSETDPSSTHRIKSRQMPLRPRELLAR